MVSQLSLTKEEDEMSISFHECGLGDLYGFRKLLKGEMKLLIMDDGSKVKSLRCKFGKIEMTFFADLPESKSKEVKE